MKPYTIIAFLALPGKAMSHYCSNQSNGVVPPLDDHAVVDLCSFSEGKPIPVTFSGGRANEQGGQPDRVFRFGGSSGTTWTFATCGYSSEVGTGLSVWKNSTDGGMELVDCDNDSCQLSRNASSLVFAPPDDATYLLRPWIYDASSADFAFGYASGGGCGTRVVQNRTVAGCAPLTVVLRTDAFSNETSFVVTSVSNGTEMMNYPEGTLYRAFHKYVKKATCLSPSDCYELTVRDQWADGMCCYSGLGSYEVVYDGVQVATGGSFGESVTHRFGNCET